MAMKKAKADARFRPAVGPLLFAAELPLGADQAPLSGAQMPRGGDGLDGAVAARDRSEPDQAKIDPGGAGHRWQRGRIAFDHEGGIEAAVRLSDDGDAGRHRGQFAGPPHAYPAGIDAVIVNGRVAWDGENRESAGRALRRGER